MKKKRMKIERDIQPIKWETTLVVILLLIVHCPLSICQERVLPFLPESGQFVLPEGSLTVTDMVLCEEGDSLMLSMELFLISKGVNPSQSWRIRPEVKSEGGSVFFPSVLINGKGKEQQFIRRSCLKDPRIKQDDAFVRQVVDKRKGHRIHYKVKVPYQQWMDSGKLHLHQILTSCRERGQWFTIYDVAPVELAVFVPYIPQVRINYIEPPEQAKIREMQGVAFLDFHSGSTVINPSYRRNTQELSKIEASIRSVRENPDVTLVGLHVHGYSSPEGSYSLNERLSQGRAGALSNYIRTSFNLSAGILHVSSTPEDWNGLREKVEESDLHQRERILSIIDNSGLSPDAKEGQLKALGSTYQTLLNNYFPSLRRVSYRIEYTVRDFTPLEAAALLEQNPGNLSPAELFHLAETHGEDSPRWEEILRLSALLYPDEPVTQVNLLAVLLKKGDLRAAGEIAEKVKDLPEAANNIGAWYLLSREPEKAEEYLLRAREQGSLSSEVNLKEVEKVKADILRQARRPLPASPRGR